MTVHEMWKYLTDLHCNFSCKSVGERIIENRFISVKVILIY